MHTLVRTDSDVLMQEEPDREEALVDSAVAAALDEGDHSEAGELKAFLDRLELSKLLANFIEQRIEMEYIAELTDEDLQKLGLEQMGLRKRFLRAAAEEKSAAVRLISPD